MGTITLPQPTRLPTPTQLPRPGLPPLPIRQSKPGSPSLGGVDTRAYINPEGFPNKSHLPHSHEKNTGPQINNLVFAPVTIKPPKYKPNETWTVAVPPPGDAVRRQLLIAASASPQRSPQKKKKRANRASGWVGPAAKLAQLEHDEAMHEHAAIQAVYQRESMPEESWPVLAISTCHACVLFWLLLATPAILAGLAFAADFGAAAILCAAILPLLALPALWLTPLSSPADVVEFDANTGSPTRSPAGIEDVYPSPTSSRSASPKSLHLSSPETSPSIRRSGHSLRSGYSLRSGHSPQRPAKVGDLQAEQMAEVSNATQDMFATSTQLLLFATALAQFGLVGASTELQDNLIASVLVATSATFQLLTVGIWMLGGWSRDGCCAGALGGLDRLLAHLRLVRAAVVRGTQEELLKRLEVMRPRLTSPGDEIHAKLLPNTQASTSWWCRSVRPCTRLCRPTIATFNAFGGHVRQSPLETLVLVVNLAVALGLGLRRPFTFSGVALTSLVAALAGAVAMADYVRSITHVVDYAEGLGYESERRERIMAERNAHSRLESALLLPVDDLATDALNEAIIGAEEAGVSFTLLAEARQRLVAVAEQSFRRKTELEEQRMHEQEAIETARKAIVVVAASTPLHVDLGRLMLVIDSGRSANVPREIIDGAEAKLKEATHAQARRTSASARLQAFLYLDPTAMAIEGARRPSLIAQQSIQKAEANGDEQQETTEEDTQPFIGVDLNDLDGAVEEARQAGVNEIDIEKVLLIRNQVVKAQMGLSAQVALAHVKLRQRGMQARWKKAGGDDRLERATAAGHQALKLLSTESDRGPLSAATEGLAAALSEAIKLGLQTPEVKGSEEVLRALREANVALDRAHALLDHGMDLSENIRSYDKLIAAEKMLSDALRLGREAHADAERIRLADDAIKQVYTLIRACSKADENLRSAVAFTVEHLKRFHAKQSSQLKMVALPALTSALSMAKSSLVAPDKIRDGDEKLREAIKAEARVDEASQWLSTASKAAVKALSDSGGTAGNTLAVAIESLGSAIKGATSEGVDPEDIASAQALLNTLRLSVRRHSLKKMPTMPPSMLAKYQSDPNVSGHNDEEQQRAVPLARQRSAPAHLAYQA